MKVTTAPPALPQMNEEEYLLFNEMISHELGISFPEHKREVLASRLRPRLLALRLPRYVDYFLQLQSDTNGEKKRLAELVTNNETFFFRETQQIEAFFDVAVERLKPDSAVPGTLRLLSAGCSSGEEPYTLNFFARQSFVRLATTTISVDAFDVDASRIAMARRAEYGPPSLRSTQPHQLERYFVAAGGGAGGSREGVREAGAAGGLGGVGGVGGGEGAARAAGAGAAGTQRWAVKPAYRGGLRFFCGNILDLRSYAAPFAYDAVFCRNVLIYFSEPALRAAVRNFAHVLRPGGLLFLGASESIIGLSESFETVRFGTTIGYRKVGR